LHLYFCFIILIYGFGKSYIYRTSSSGTIYGFLFKYHFYYTYDYDFLIPTSILLFIILMLLIYDIGIKIQKLNNAIPLFISGSISGIAGLLHPLCFNSYPSETPLNVFFTVIASFMLNRSHDLTRSLLFGYIIGIGEVYTIYLIQESFNAGYGVFQPLISLGIIIPLLVYRYALKRSIS